MLRQAPAIVDIALVDDAGIERLSVSRIGLNSAGSGVDRSADAAVRAARAAHVHGMAPSVIAAARSRS